MWNQHWSEIFILNQILLEFYNRMLKIKMESRYNHVLGWDGKILKLRVDVEEENVLGKSFNLSLCCFLSCSTEYSGNFSISWLKIHSFAHELVWFHFWTLQTISHLWTLFHPLCQRVAELTEMARRRIEGLCTRCDRRLASSQATHKPWQPTLPVLPSLPCISTPRGAVVSILPPLKTVCIRGFQLEREEIGG